MIITLKAVSKHDMEEHTGHRRLCVYLCLQMSNSNLQFLITKDLLYFVVSKCGGHF